MLSHGTSAKNGLVLSASSSNIRFGVLPPEIAIRATPRAFTAATALSQKKRAAASATAPGVGDTEYATCTVRGIKYKAPFSYCLRQWRPSFASSLSAHSGPHEPAL